MAKQTINIGTVANDGTGDTLRDSFDITNDNFTELYSTAGWGNYSDGETTPATITINTTPTKLLIDGLGSLTETGYLPREIRGTAELWDTTNDKILPITIGDSYDLRVGFEVTAKSGSPNVIGVFLDIGGGAAITISIAEIQVPLVSSVPFKISVAIPIFSLATFKTNGGQIFLATDAGTITIGERDILIKRDFKGDM